MPAETAAESTETQSAVAEASVKEVSAVEKDGE